MIFFWFIYVSPTSFTEYKTVQKNWREWPSELWQWLEGSLLKTPLGAKPYLGTQPCYEAPADLFV